MYIHIHIYIYIYTLYRERAIERDIDITAYDEGALDRGPLTIPMRDRYANKQRSRSFPPPTFSSATLAPSTHT